MQKIQVLFSDSIMTRLRAQAKAEDRPMSEIIRRATEGWLKMQPTDPPPSGARLDPPVFRLGGVKVNPQKLRQILYD